MKWIAALSGLAVIVLTHRSNDLKARERKREKEKAEAELAARDARNAKTEEELRAARQMLEETTRTAEALRNKQRFRSVSQDQIDRFKAITKDAPKIKIYLNLDGPGEDVPQFANELIGMFKAAGYEAEIGQTGDSFPPLIGVQLEMSPVIKDDLGAMALQAALRQIGFNWPVAGHTIPDAKFIDIRVGARPPQEVK